MYMPEIVDAVRIEIQDRDKATPIWEDYELVRAVQKSVSLLSRLMPKRAIVETQITVEVEDESLTIASSTGTLANKPVKEGSLAITGESLDTDYTVNYLTGVITEVGSLLADGTYTADYEIDPHILNISSLLTDYIKIERVEYPVGDDPATFITPIQEVFATYLIFKETLEEDKHIRITYLTYWTPPTASDDGDFPRSLDNAIIIGSSGQALIFKAEKYVQTALSETDGVITLLDTIDTLSLAAPALTAPTAPTLATLTAPTVYTIVKPTSPVFAAAPTAPTAPTLTFTAAEAAMTAISTEITAAKAHHTSGAALINTTNTGQNVAENYGEYAKAVFNAANTRVQEALAQLREIEDTLQKYASQVTSYGSDVNAYANLISGQIGKYREDINNELAGINNVNVNVARYKAQIDENQVAVNKYAQQVASYQVDVAEYQQEVAAYVAEATAILNRASQVATQVNNYLNIAGRYLASGQAKINEMITMLGVKAEFNFYKASSEQFS